MKATDRYTVYFNVGKRKQSKTLKAVNEWDALFKVSEKHGKNFRLIQVNLVHELYGEIGPKIGACTKCHQPVGIGMHFVCPHSSLTQSFAARFDPVVVHVDNTGKVSFPGRSDAKLPPGYERRELRTIQEVRAFQKEYNKRAGEEHEVRQGIKEAQFSENQARHRSDLRVAMMSMSRYGRDFARLAMEVNDKRRKSQPAPVGYFEAFENDASNRDAHRDELTGWRPRK